LKELLELGLEERKLSRRREQLVLVAHSKSLEIRSRKILLRTKPHLCLWVYSEAACKRSEDLSCEIRGEVKSQVGCARCLVILFEKAGLTRTVIFYPLKVTCI
jgi:hypothetical protein